MEGLVIRAEVPADHRAVEEMTREAFWNVYAPGCEEHWWPSWRDSLWAT